MAQKPIGSTFGAEILAAGLAGLPFSWNPDGTITFGGAITEPQREAVLAVYAAHDPASAALADLRTAKRKLIDAAYEARLASGSGIALQGAPRVFQIDPESRSNITGLATTAALVLLAVPGVAWPDGGQPYRTMDNVWLLLTAAETLALSQKVKADFTSIRRRYSDLKDACAAADQAALAAIDPAAGWPALGV